MDSLTFHLQQLLIKKFVKDSLATEVELKIDNTCYMAIRIIHKIIHTMFLRKEASLHLWKVGSEA